MINAVFDRSRADVDRVIELNKKYLNGTITDAEKAEWMSGLKGAINYTDLNRIESNCGIVAEHIAIVVQTKTWKRNDIPRVSDFLRIRNNVEKIRASYAALSTTPTTPIQPINTFQKWNDIEKILYDIDTVYHRTMDAFVYCGEDVYSGEDIGVI